VTTSPAQHPARQLTVLERTYAQLLVLFGDKQRAAAAAGIGQRQLLKVAADAAIATEVRRLKALVSSRAEVRPVSSADSPNSTDTCGNDHAGGQDGTRVLDLKDLTRSDVIAILKDNLEIALGRKPFPRTIVTRDPARKAVTYQTVMVRENNPRLAHQCIKMLFRELDKETARKGVQNKFEPLPESAKKALEAFRRAAGLVPKGLPQEGGSASSRSPKA